MPKPNGHFQKRLQRCVDRGNLTVADLQRWFDRPYQTVRFWLYRGYSPAGGPRTKEKVMARLDVLETTVHRHASELQALSMGDRARRLQELGR